MKKFFSVIKRVLVGTLYMVPIIAAHVYLVNALQSDPNVIRTLNIVGYIYMGIYFFVIGLVSISITLALGIWGFKKLFNIKINLVKFN